jgi:hypothetical protein
MQLDETQAPEPTGQDIWDSLDQPAPAPQDTKEEPAAPAAAPEAAKEPAADDPYRDLPEAVRNTIMGLQTQVGALSQRVRQSEGRLGELNGTVKQWQAKPAPVEPAEKSARLEQIRSDYPEIFEGVDEVIQAKVPQVPDGLTRAEVQALLEKQAKDFEVEVVHRGWKKTVQTPEFTGWYSQQPAEIKALAESDDPAVAIRMLDLFSGAKVKKAPNQSIAEAAAIPTGRSRATSRGKPLEEMTDQELWDHYNAQDLAKARK